MSTFVDTSVFCGHWPFRCLPHRRPESLKAHLRSHGVVQAWVAAVEAILYPDPMQANEPLFEAIKGDDFFVPVAVIDPTLPTWGRDTQTSVTDGGCGALKLFPNYHGYDLSAPAVSDLLQLARRADIPICIQLRMMDERSHHPLMITPPVPAPDVAELARRHPRNRFLVCGAYLADLPALAGPPNVWAEISMVDAAWALRAAVDAIPADRLVFGSHSPLLYFQAVAAKLNVDPRYVGAERVEAICRTNARRLLGRPA